MPNPTDADILKTDLAGLSLVSPVLTAAGTAGVLDETAGVMDLSKLGALVTKSITPEPRDGNRTWRLWPLREGMLNAVGLANPGVDHFAEHIAPRAKEMPCPVIGSISGFRVDDYVRVAGAMNEAAERHGGIQAVELNVSCPNVDGGTSFGATVNSLSELINAVRPICTHTRLFVKLSPIAFGPPGIVELARAAAEPMGGQPAGPNSRPGADALVIANTMPAMSIDPETRKPALSRVTGGLSGPAIRPVSVKLVYDTYKDFARDSGTPIIGLGGVRTWRDAAEYILAGATAVAMGTMLFASPKAPIKVANGLAKWTRRQGFGSLSELTGRIEIPARPPRTPS